MWPAIAITFFLLALLAAALRFNRKELEEDRAVLLHTINVNLDILDSELVELKAIAQASSSHAAQTARERLNQAQTVATAARASAPHATNEKLESILVLVFHAMNQATEARRLLNAFTPK